MQGIADFREGAIFAGDFTIVRRLAAGGMGAVYVAEQIATGRQRALKLMHPGLVGSPELREKFGLEARVGARIASEHVVEVVAAGVDAASGLPWLAMELLVGEDLSHAVKRRGAFTPAETSAVLAQVCHALDAAHAAGIVHRDLKPENIFLAETKRAHESYMVKLLDFGIAKVLEAARGSNTGAIGSPLWMAPEQTERHAEISAVTDVWALGLVAFWMLTGKHFWLAADENDMALSAFLRELVLDPVPSASARAAELGVGALVPTTLDGWFAKTLAREREGRFASAGEAYAAFRELAGTGPVPSVIRAGAGTVRVSSGDVLADASQTATDRLASARTLPHVTGDVSSGAGRAGDTKRDDDDDDDEPAVGVPPGGPSKLFIGAIALGGIAIAAGAIALLRGSSSTGPATSDAGAGGSTLPYCPKGMVRIAAGELMMGSASGSSEEQPPHSVKVGAFCMDTTEVTVHDYRECVDKKACTGGRTQVDWPAITKEDRDTWSAFCNEGKAARSDHPMNCISFDDASAYCKFSGKKLPTEDQWEYAARSTDGRAYP